MKKFFLLFLFCSFALTSSVWAATYYMDDTGSSDSNTGAIGSPWATFTKAFTTMVAGDTLYLRAGTYAQPITDSSDLPSGSDWPSASTISRYQNEVVTITRGSSSRVMRFVGPQDAYMIISGLILDGTGATDVVKIEAGAHHIRMQDCEVKNGISQGIIISSSSPAAGPWSRFNEFIRLKVYDNGLADPNPDADTLNHGIYISAPDNLVEYSEFYDNRAYGVHVYEGLAFNRGNNNTIRYNKVHDNGYAGILLSSGTGNRAYRNLIYNNTTYGLQIGWYATNTLFYNNTIYGNPSGGIEIRNITGTGTVLRNNIFRNTGTAFVFSGTNPKTFSDITTSNNRCSASSTGCTSTTDPLFTDATTPNWNFALLTGSPAVDAGVTIAGYSANGNPDQGAHETFTCASAVVPNAASNTLKLTCINNINTPLLPSTGCHVGFTVLKAGIANPPTSCTRSGDNVLTLTLTNAFTSGQSATVAYSSTTGVVTNSANIGNTANQKLFTFSAITADNQVGASGPVLEQINFRFRCVGGDEDTPDCVKLVNTNITIPPGKFTVVRGQIRNTVANFGSSGYALYAQKNGSGGYAAIPNGPTPTTGISFVTGTSLFPPELVSGLTTPQLAGAGTWAPGGVQLSASATPDVELQAGEYTELDAALVVGSGNIDGDFYDLRWCRDGGAALTTYSQTPRITISATGHLIQTGAR